MSKKTIIQDRKLFVFTLLFIISFLFMATIFSQDLFKPDETNTGRFDEINYNVNPDNSELRKPVVITNTIEEHDFISTEINMGFKVLSSDAEEEQIIFRTSNGDFGIELSLTSDNTLLLKTGSTVFKGYKTYSLIDTIKNNVWYDLRIHIATDKRIEVFIDGEILLNTKDKSLICLLEKIFVGGDVSDEKGFQGKIKNFSIEFNTYIVKHKHILTALKLLSIAIFILFTILLMRYLSQKNFFSSFAFSTRDYKIKFIGTIIVIGFVIAVFFHYSAGMYFNAEYPYNTFLFRPEDKFRDFYNKYNLYRDGFVPSGIFDTTPLLNIIRYFLGKFGGSLAFGIYLLSFLGTFIYFNYKYLKLSKKIDTILVLFIFTFLSYPFLITMDRSNPETYVFIFLILFIYFYQKEKTIISSIFLALAICVKPFPAVFLALLIADKKYKEIGLVIAFILVIHSIRIFIFYLAGGIHFGEIAFIPLHNIRPDFISCSFVDGIKNFFSDNGFIMDSYNQIYVIGNEGTSFNHSLFVLIKIAIGYLHLWIYGHTSGVMEDVSSIFYFYLGFSVIILILIGIYIRKYEKTFWKKVALLVIAMNILPFVSADYKLLHLFIPLYLFLNNQQEEKHNFIYIIIFSLLLIPKSYAHLDLLYPEASIGVIINPVLMLTLSGIITLSGMKKTKGVTK